MKITLAFKLVFFTVVGLTLLSGSTALWLASQEKLSSHQERVFETCSNTWLTGVGAVFGLLGGKATDFLHQEEEKEDKDSQ